MLKPAIATLSGNRYLLDALRRLDVKMQSCRVTLCLSKEKIRQSGRLHDRIMEAIRRRDTQQARSLMRQHIRGALQHSEGNTDE